MPIAPGSRPAIVCFAPSLPSTLLLLLPSNVRSYVTKHILLSKIIRLLRSVQFTHPLEVDAPTLALLHSSTPAHLHTCIPAFLHSCAPALPHCLSLSITLHLVNNYCLARLYLLPLCQLLLGVSFPFQPSSHRIEALSLLIRAVAGLRCHAISSRPDTFTTQISSPRLTAVHSRCGPAPIPALALSLPLSQWLFFDISYSRITAL